jgi:hypothetical protein
VKRLDLLGKRFVSLHNTTDHMRWQELFRPFINMQALHVSKTLCPFIAPSLQGLTGEQGAEVLPSLLYLFFEGLWPPGPVHKATSLFVSARQQSGCPITVLRWVREPDMDSEFGDWDIEE